MRVTRRRRPTGQKHGEVFTGNAPRKIGLAGKLESDSYMRAWIGRSRPRRFPGERSLTDSRARLAAGISGVAWTNECCPSPNARVLASGNFPDPAADARFPAMPRIANVCRCVEHDANSPQRNARCTVDASPASAG